MLFVGLYAFFIHSVLLHLEPAVAAVTSWAYHPDASSAGFRGTGATIGTSTALLLTCAHVDPLGPQALPEPGEQCESVPLETSHRESVAAQEPPTKSHSSPLRPGRAL